MTVRDENGNWTRDRMRVRYAVYEYQNGAIRRDAPHVFEGTRCLDLLDMAMAGDGEPGEDRRAYVRRKLRRLRALGLEADESEWREWSDQPVRDYYSNAPISFFGVLPCRIVEREIQ